MMRLPNPLNYSSMASENSGIPRPAMRKKTTDPETVSKCNADWRFLCLNINNFPTEKSGDDKAKLDLLRATLYASNADVMGITELGRNEYKMTTHNRPSEITKKWFENGRSLPTWNQDSITSYEPGGALIISRDKSSAHTIKKGTDDRKLGRWA